MWQWHLSDCLLKLESWWTELLGVRGGFSSYGMAGRAGAGRGRKQENEIGQRLSLEKEDGCCALDEHHRERCRKPTPKPYTWIKTCGPFTEFSSSKATSSER